MKQQHVFNIDFTSELDGQHYVGMFTCKRRSIKDVSNIGVRVIQLSGGMSYDPENPGQGVDGNIYSLNYMIAVLEISLVSKPEWFDLNNIYDMDLLSLVYKEVADFEATFRRPARQEVVSTPVSTTGSTQENNEANRSATVRTMVVNKIQASLEP
jgi:hypothetical protein